MKNKSILCALLVACGVGFSTTSCEDMLSADSERTIHTNANDTLYGYWGIMKAVQNIAERYVILGEIRGDLTSPTSYIVDSISNIANFIPTKDGDCRYLDVKDYYTVINGCNNYLANVDSLKTNSSGYRVMEKEIAQILAVRAWTYLQLVNNYGEVPYYTEAITSLDFIDNFDFNKESNRLSRANLIQMLASDLERYKEVALPDYGNYNNGAKEIASTLTMFPIKLVLGDIYLTGATSVADYEKAAQNYYEYLKENKAYLPTSLACDIMGTIDPVYRGNSWMEIFTSNASPTTNNYSGEAITVIPSSAGILYGNVLTGVANIFGWKTTSSMNTDFSDGSESQGTSSASVSAYTDLAFRQIGPSGSYLSLCKTQQYLKREATNDPIEVAEEVGDARQAALYEMPGNGVLTSSIAFIEKPCPNFSFSYTYPIIYRKALVWLRYAEAINRAGFPSYAFAVLKNGLCKEYLPEMVVNPDTLQTDSVYYTINKKCYYITKPEFDRAKTKSNFMNYSSEFTFLSGTEAANVGIHSRGCGGNVVGEDTVYYTYNNMLVQYGLDASTATLADSIDAVENMIVDELALETAWEGNRYPDLLRIASHKGTAGDAWFIDKIARRGDPRDPNIDYSESPDYLYLKNQLSDKNNWYLKLPSYK